jgi:radical SAM superfamily enzyme
MTISSSDPRFPSINIRAEILSHVLPADLIAWATHLGAKPDGNEDAILAILRQEYDEITFQTWLEIGVKPYGEKP